MRDRNNEWETTYLTHDLTIAVQLQEWKMSVKKLNTIEYIPEPKILRSTAAQS